MKFTQVRIPFTKMAKLAGVMIALLITRSAFHFNAYNENRQDQIREQALNNFGRSGKVLEIYEHRTGTKEANYVYHRIAVLENESTKRLNVEIENESPVVGEIWQLRYDPRGNINKLEKKIDQLIPAQKFTLPKNDLEEWVKTNVAYLKSPIFIIGLVAIPLGLGTFALMLLAITLTIISMVGCGNLFKREDREEDYFFFISIYPVVFALMLICASTCSFIFSAEHFIAASSALNAIFGIGIICGMVLTIVGIGYALVKS
jgi:hypothetical protein